MSVTKVIKNILGDKNIISVLSFCASCVAVFELLRLLYTYKFIYAICRIHAITG